MKDLVIFPFQVKIKSPGAENAAKTAARRRLESYADTNLPRLLGSRSTRTKRCEQRADKAPWITCITVGTVGKFLISVTWILDIWFEVSIDV
jgi:hypothetical protein